MLRSIHNTIIVLLAAFALGGCTRTDVDVDAGREGDPADLLIQLRDESMTAMTRGVNLTEEQEHEIKSLFLFVFDSNGALVSSTEHISVEAHKGENGNAADRWDPIAIHTTIGNNRTIYAVANYNAQVIENIKSVGSVEDLQNLVVQNLGNPLSQEQGLIKVGKLDTDIRAGEKYTIPMRNIVSKITILVKNRCDNLDITGWTIDGFPLKSYVVERPVNTNDPNYHDAANIYEQTDYYNSFSDQSFAFDKNDPVAGGMDYSITGYCYENRRGGRVASKGEPPAGWPNGNGTETIRDPYQLKSWYAPANATRVRILGYDKADGRALVINHYLGENNSDDYNVKRNFWYTYTITINSLDKINIDTNVDQTRYGLSVQAPPDLTNIDAHASVRMFQLGTDHLSSGSGTVNFEVLQTLTSENRPTWLKAAVFPTITYQVRGNSATQSAITTWQQEATEGYYVRTKFIPHKSVRATLSGYTPPSGITLGTADYPSDDDVLSYEKAIHRMCFKITDLPLGTVPTSMFVYADEYPYTSDPLAPDYREAVVRITYTPASGDPETYDYTLRQYRPLRFMGLPGESSPMVIERTEDYAGMVQTYLSLGLQTLGGLQWGPYASADPAETALGKGNGFLNTAQAIYKSAAASGTRAGWTGSWSDERVKYGSNTGEWTGANGAVEQPVTAMLSGAPYFLYNLDGTDYYNTIFNTTAARYCHEKNFDKNGDGIISSDETEWYLPSEQELQLMWTYNEMLGLSPAFYWSSTLPAAAGSNAIALSMRKSLPDVGTVHNGVPQERVRTGYKENTLTPPRVRCVRRQSGVEPLRPIVTTTIDGRSVMDCSNLSGDLYTSASKLGLSQKDPASLQNTNTKVYKRLEVQSTDGTQVTYDDLYHGAGLCNESLGWRLPTQREMLMIYSVRDLLEKNTSFGKFQDMTYWTMQRVYAGAYLVDFSTGLASYDTGYTGGKHYYRCVREL